MMKRDFEWLKGEIAKRMIELEPYRADKLRDERYKTLRSVAQKLNQLDEPEVLSQEWVDNNSVYASHDGVTEEYVHVDDLQSLLVPTISEIETVDITEGQIMDWLDDNEFYHHATAETVLANAVDKGELGYYGTKYSVVKRPVIPKYVAKYLEFAKSDVSLMRVMVVAYSRDELPEWKKEYDWIEANDETFARAWVDGYTVEEEPLYYAKLKEVQPPEEEWLTNLSGPNYYAIDTKGLMFGEFILDLVGMTTKASAYTLKDWERHGINDSNADFVEVAE